MCWRPARHPEPVRRLMVGPAPVPDAALAANTPDGDSVLTFPAYAARAVRLESTGKAETDVAMAPSVSYSITVRLEVASRGRAVSEITRAVEQAGGVVTALDVTAGGNERLRVDVTCAARDTAHAEAIVAALAEASAVAVAVADAATQNPG